MFINAVFLVEVLNGYLEFAHDSVFVFVFCLFSENHSWQKQKTQWGGGG